MVTAPVPDAQGLHDGLGRRVDYVRLSLTDRCDLRCTYCMGEDMAFLPRAALLSADEIAELAGRFVARGVRRIRLTGGEPLGRRDARAIAQGVGAMLGQGLDELTLTTNGTRLARFAADLHAAGIRRVNVSLDTLDAARFRTVTRGGDIAQVFAGIAGAAEAGLAVKINTVALRGVNEDEIVAMLRWCGERGHDLSLIEAMPLGAVGGRAATFLPLSEARDTIEREFTLLPSTKRTGGPARYWQVPALGVTLGLISPLTHNFCDSCNRVRVSADGQLYMCLGHEDRVDLRAALRGQGDETLDEAFDRALRLKPARHAFAIGTPATQRHMSVTGG